MHKQQQRKRNETLITKKILPLVVWTKQVDRQQDKHSVVSSGGEEAEDGVVAEDGGEAAVEKVKDSISVTTVGEEQMEAEVWALPHKPIGY